MVKWKGDVDRDSCGGKAFRLDQISSFNVPNFFVITRDEIAEFVGDATEPQQVMEKELPGALRNRIEEAYSEIGMSSEVRESSDRARDLVGGSRDSQMVSIRVSGERKAVYKYRLNTGNSELWKGIKQVVASFYEVKSEERYPAVLVQQMVEPEYSGAAVTNYLDSYQLVELVEGLGVPLEDGTTRPEFYLLRNGSTVQTSLPERQLKVTLNQMNGGHQQKTVSRNGPSLQEQEVESFMEQLSHEEFDVKFVYKRGSFYIIDAFERTEGRNPFSTTETTLDGVRVSQGEISGTIGEDIRLTDDTVPPEEYGQALISRKGGYSSTDAQLAREAGKPAVFSFNSELPPQQGNHLELGPKDVKPGEERDTGPVESFETARDQMLASEVLPIDSGNPGIHLSPPFGPGYAVTDMDVQATRIPRTGYLQSYADIFAFDGDRAVLDARMLGPRGLEAAMEYLDASLMVLLLDRPDPGLVRKGIEQGFDVFGIEPSRLEELQETVEREERRFMLERLRDL